MSERTYSTRTAAEVARPRARPVALLMMFACACLLMSAAEATAASVTSGFVYVMTNQPGKNTVIRFARAPDGALTRLQEVPTGGSGGTGNGVGALDPLGSQDSLVLAGTGSVLIAVNAGSNGVSTLVVDSGGLAVRSANVPSGGAFPNSVAVHGTLVYVLNAHTPNIAGFRLDATGSLAPIPGAIFPLPTGAGSKPHDIRFSPDGTRLLVSIEGANEIDVFALDSQGLVTGATRNASIGNGPFGMRFARGNVLVNVEANSASASSYALNADDTLRVITGAVPSTQAATCWITMTGDAKFGFVSNTASGTISTYHVSANGTLNLESAVAASLPGGAPIDSSLTSDSAFMYVLDSAQGHLAGFAVTGASLRPIGTVVGLPTTLQGIAAQ